MRLSNSLIQLMTPVRGPFGIEAPRPVAPWVLMVPGYCQGNWCAYEEPGKGVLAFERRVDAEIFAIVRWGEGRGVWTQQSPFENWMDVIPARGLSPELLKVSEQPIAVESNRWVLYSQLSTWAGFTTEGRGTTVVKIQADRRGNAGEHILGLAAEQFGRSHYGGRILETGINYILLEQSDSRKHYPLGVVTELSRPFLQKWLQRLMPDAEIPDDVDLQAYVGDHFVRLLRSWPAQPRPPIPVK
jgi:hypothetical protein